MLLPDGPEVNGFFRGLGLRGGVTKGDTAGEAGEVPVIA